MRRRFNLISPIPPPAPEPFNLTIAQSLYAPNIRALAAAAGWNGTDELIVHITAALIGALDIGSTAFPRGIRLNISAGTRVGGAPGGVAFVTRTFVTINNAGIISGGGGVGGRGTNVTSFRVGNTTKGGAGGGVGGAGYGMLNSGGTASVKLATTGSAGTRVDISDSTTGLSGWARGGNGGRGGDWGVRGAPDDNHTKSSNATILAINKPEIDRSPGAAVDGNSHISWSALGTIVGTRIN